MAATRKEMEKFILRHTFERGWQGDGTGDVWCEVVAGEEIIFELHGYAGRDGTWTDTIEEKLKRAPDYRIEQWFKAVGHAIHGIPYDG